MKYEDAKKMLLEDEELKREYDALALNYEIIEAVIRIRIENKLTQKNLAELAGTTPSMIARLENGFSNPSIGFLNKIAHAVGKELHISFN